ncbi:MAG: response regulator [Rhodoferax sp.]|nr:response regulator [Rhodoferax sp.]
MPTRLLIIEDDSASRALVCYLLEAAGYATLEAEDGGTGLHLALHAQPDLIICDLQMPVMNGYEVARALREHPDWHRVPLIAVTAFSMAGDRETALSAGFDEHITKPITPETFVTQIEAFLPHPLQARHSPGH